MNTASLDLPHHLGRLRDRMLHKTDYELAVTYFLDEFAGDAGFHKLCEVDDAPPLLAVMQHVASKIMGRWIGFEQSKVFRLVAYGFYHGSVIVDSRVIVFFYFQQADTGIAALMPEGRDAMEVARFRLTEGLVDPRKN